MESLQQGIGIEFNNVSYSIESRTIVHPFSGVFLPGTFTACMGPSGCGKTSLVDILSGRSKGVGSVGGTVTLNRTVPIKKASSCEVAYVKQEDTLFPVLTVRETLYYSAKLRLPADTTEEETNARVNSILETLWLTECADRRVGGGNIKGISGGQRRRVSVGVDLVTRPSVIFLDEPTTGLDASASLVLMRALRRLADAGHTVIATVHQPRWESYLLLDNVLLMGAGRRLYHGPAKQVTNFLRECGFQCDGLSNPADWMLDVVSGHNLSKGSSFETIEARSERIMKQFESSHPISVSPLIPNIMERCNNSLAWQTQLKVLTQRYFKIITRHPLDILFLLFEAMVFGILIAILWSDLENARRVQNLGTFFLFFIATLSFMPVDAMPPLMEQRSIYLQERERGAYSPSAFFFAQVVAYTPPYALVVLVALLWTYFTIGLTLSISSFFFLYLDCCLVFWTMNTITFGTVFWLGSYGKAFAATIIIVILNYLLMGISVSLDDLGPHVKWASYLVFFQYAQAAFFLNEFGDSNSDVNSYFPRILNDKWTNIFVLIGFLLALRIVTFLLLKYRAEVPASRSSIYARVLSKIRSAKNGVNSPITNDTVIELSSVSMNPEGIMLTPDERVELSFADIMVSMSGKGSKEKKVLHSLNGTFRPGTLTALMGPSGSGKTTLLKVLSGRVKIPGKVEGEVFLNGIRRKEFKGLSHTVAYVTQDPLLLPTVTVREAIKFSAKLRLPDILTAEETNGRVDDIISTLGLEECANTLIGDEINRGVSGGQKKRASVGIDLVTRPAVLLLDEPTSGLDSSSSDQVVQTLRRLADAGHTVIVSIHQPRWESFSLFDDVFLMARGKLVYRGPIKEAPAYFENLGYKIPDDQDQTINPADFIVDVVNGGANLGESEVNQREMKALEVAETFSESYASSSLAKNYQAMTTATTSRDQEDIEYSANWFTQLRTLTHRFIKVSIRDFYRYGVLVMESIIFGVLLAYIFGGTLDNDEDPRKPIFQVGSWFGMLLTVVCYAPLGTLDANLQFYHVFLQERQRATYRSSSFAAAYFLVALIPNLIESFMLVIFSFFVMDMPKQGADNLFYLVFVLFAVALGCNLIAVLIVLVSGNRDIAYSVQVIILTFVVIFSGMLVPEADLPSWIRWGYYINFSSYAFSGFMLDQYGINHPILEQVFGIPFNNKWMLVGILCAIVIIWEILFFLALVGVSRQTKPKHL